MVASRTAGIVLLSLALILTLLLLLPGGGFSSAGPSQRRVVCSVEVRNPLIESPVIDLVSCQLGDPCGLFGLEIVRLGILDLLIPSDRGKVILDVGGERDEAGYDINLGATQQFQLSVCSGLTSGEIILTDPSNREIDRQTFDVV